MRTLKRANDLFNEYDPEDDSLQHALRGCMTQAILAARQAGEIRLVDAAAPQPRECVTITNLADIIELLTGVSG